MANCVTPASTVNVMITTARRPTMLPVEVQKTVYINISSVKSHLYNFFLLKSELIRFRRDIFVVPLEDFSF